MSTGNDVRQDQQKLDLTKLFEELTMTISAPLMMTMTTKRQN